MATHIINIDAHGTAVFIWNDDLAGMRDLGAAHIRRASHVEPTAAGQWTADMEPMAGPALGPFDLRGDALAAEVDWLRKHLDGTG